MSAQRVIFWRRAFLCSTAVLVLYLILFSRARLSDGAEFQTDDRDGVVAVSAKHTQQGHADESRPVLREAMPTSTTKAVEGPLGVGAGESLTQTPPETTGMPNDPALQEAWIVENRQLYFEADLRSIRATMDRFSEALAEDDAKKIQDAAWSLMSTSIAVILAKSGREVYVANGGGVSMRTDSPDEHVFLRNNWLYRFHRSEFPEYFELRLDRANPSGDPQGQSVTSAQIVGIEAHAQRALRLLLP